MQINTDTIDLSIKLIKRDERLAASRKVLYTLALCINVSSLQTKQVFFPLKSLFEMNLNQMTIDSLVPV